MSDLANEPFKTLNVPDGSWDDESASLAPGTVLDGKYELLEQLESGGMGVVWKAKDRIADRLVALKFVQCDPKRYETEMERMRKTFRKVHALHHSSICPLYSLDKDHKFGYYLVMKYLKGETLERFVLRSDPLLKGLPIESVVELLTPVAEALDYAHKNGVIHRDIKPSNVFLVRAAKGVEVQVIDFGIAGEIMSTESHFQQEEIDTSGTPCYMAPEQWEMQPGRAATDQYSLAVVAYQLLAGRLPFVPGPLAPFRLAVLNSRPKSIREMPEHVNGALLKALAKDGKERFETCTEFIAALRVPHRKPPQPVVPGVESLMTRGHLALEDADWNQAIKHFDSVLNIDAKYAPAYIGLLCAELKLQSEERLGGYEKPIADFGNFKKAVRFADDEYRTKIEGYDEKIRKRLRQEQEKAERKIDKEAEAKEWAITERRRVALVKAVAEGNILTAKHLIEAGANANAKDKEGDSLLHIAASKNNKKMVEFLVKAGANINEPDKDGNTLLYQAVKNNIQSWIPFLEELGAHPESGVLSYHSRLNDFTDALKEGTVEDVRYFLEKGFLINAKDSNACTPLHYAAMYNSRVEVVKYLVLQGADVQAKNKVGHTPLHTAAWSSNPEVLKYLVSQGVNVNLGDVDGDTPIHQAAWNNSNVECLEYFLSLGVDVNSKNFNDELPLHKAAQFNSNVEVLKYLILHGADVNAKTASSLWGFMGGKTPLDVANTEEKKRILRAAGGKTGKQLK